MELDQKDRIEQLKTIMENCLIEITRLKEKREKIIKEYENLSKLDMVIDFNTNLWIQYKKEREQLEREIENG